MSAIIPKTNNASLKPSEAVLLPTGLYSNQNIITYPEHVRNGTFQCLTNGSSFNLTIAPTMHTVTGWHLKQNGGSNVDLKVLDNSGVNHVPAINAAKYCKIDINAVGGTPSDYVIFEQRTFDVSKYAGQTIAIEFEAFADSARRMAVEVVMDEGNGRVSTIKCPSVDLTTRSKKYSILCAVPSPSGVALAGLHNLKLRFWLAAGSSFASRIGAGVASGAGSVTIANIRDGSKLSPQGRFEEEKACAKYFYNTGKRYLASTTTTVQTAFGTLTVDCDLAYVPTPASHITITGKTNMGAVTYDPAPTQYAVTIIADGTSPTSSARFDNMLINLELPE